MRLSGHQPAYLPWLGYFDKMARSDVFVHHDVAPFESSGLLHRNRVRLHRGAVWLTIPVAHEHRHGLPLHRIPLPGGRWREQHLRTIENAYRRAPQFERFIDPLRAVYAQDHGSLAALSLDLIELMRHAWGLDTPTKFASELSLEGRKSEFALNLCRRLGADTYLSGAGGSGYLDRDAFAAAGVTIEVQDFIPPTYPQRFRPFIPGLSALDALLNLGEFARALIGAPANSSSK